MTIATHWKLSAEILPQHIAGDGTVFTDVVRIVHWQCFASDGTTLARAYGTVTLAMPETMAAYIDLDSLVGADETTRRATVLGWAEMISPGFVAATAARVTARLSAQMAAPAVQMQTIL